MKPSVSRYAGRLVLPDAKTCPGCGQVKAPAEFPVNSARFDGLATYCIQCSREYANRNRRRLRIELLDFLGGECVRCGFSDWRALQIDHIAGDGAEDRRQGRGPGYDRKRVRANPERFQVLCANCNSIKRVDEGEHTGTRQYTRAVLTERAFRPRKIPAKMQAYSRARTIAAEARQAELVALVEQRRPEQRSPRPLHHRWARWYEKCLGCQSAERKHACDGLCWRCDKMAKGLNRRVSVFTDASVYAVETAPPEEVMVA